MTTLTITLLGTFQVVRHGRSLHRFESDNARALLAYLAVERHHPHRRSLLAALLWPEHDEKSARNNLRQTLFKLRKTLAEDTLAAPLLLITPQTVQFNPAAPCVVDVTEVQRHLAAATPQSQQTAVAAYTAPLLANAAFATSAAFDEWLLLAREQLHQQVMAACDHLLAAATATADWPAAVHLAQRQLTLDPWRESAARSLMQALAAQGERAAALAAFQQCRDTLWQELGVPPMPETVALAEQIRQSATLPAATSPPDVGKLAAPLRHNLPADLTPFIGRRRELAHIAQQLADPACRLLTLTGMGGMGKTRLALQAARHAYDAYPDGVWLVALADLPPDSSADQLDAAVADALPFSPSGSAPLRQQIENFLRQRRALLLLDNAEHVTAVPPYIAALLAAAAGVDCLVTSREPLGTPGEWLLPLPPLGHTGPDADQTDAVRLFFQHARMARPTFPLSVVDEPMAARICQLLDGHPLAIELAAGWVDTLTCREIAAEIEDGLHILADDSTARPLRHASITQVLTQTWQRLLPPEQAALARLAVFRGGCTREAARAVADMGLPLLKRLVDRSLVQVESSRERPSRYTLHELVRVFAAAQLGTETAATQQRHAAYLAEFLAAQVPRQRNHHYLDAMRQIEAEMGNIAAAWRWAVAQANCAFFIQGGEAAISYLYHTARFAEGIRWLEAALAVCAAAPGAYRLQNRLAQLLGWGTDNARTRAVAMAAFAAATAAADRVEAAYACFQWGVALQRLGEFAPAWEKLREGLTLAEGADATWLQAALATRLCLNAPQLGRLEAGEEYGRMACEMGQQLRQPLLLWQAEYGLSVLYWHAGRLDLAEQHAAASLAALTGSDFANFRATSLQLQAYVLLRQQRQDAALVLMDAAEQLAADVGDQDLLASLWSARGEVALAQQQWAAAIAVLEKAMAIDRQAENRWRLSQTIFLLAMAHYRLERPLATVALLREGLNLVDALREPFITYVALSTFLEWLALEDEREAAAATLAYLHTHIAMAADQQAAIADVSQRFALTATAVAPDWPVLLARLQQVLAAY